MIHSGDTGAGYMTATMALIIHKETGEECQRLLYHDHANSDQLGAGLVGAYSMQADTLWLKYEYKSRFNVIPADKNKSYHGT